MNKQEAQAERARLQNLLDAYEGDRVNRRIENERRGLRPEVTPDRADNVRARIARLDQIIADNDKKAEPE
jgi:hypothetical protein